MGAFTIWQALFTTLAAVMGVLIVVGLIVVLVVRTPRGGPSAQPA